MLRALSYLCRLIAGECRDRASIVFPRNNKVSTLSTFESRCSARNPRRTTAANSAINTMGAIGSDRRSEEHTSELQSLMRISYAVFCLKKKKNNVIVEYKRKMQPTQD